MGLLSRLTRGPLGNAALGAVGGGAIGGVASGGDPGAMATGAMLGGGLGFGVGGFGQVARQSGERAFALQHRIRQVEDLIERLPEHEKPVADMILREEGLAAAERFLRQTLT